MSQEATCLFTVLSAWLLLIFVGAICEAEYVWALSTGPVAGLLLGLMLGWHRIRFKAGD